jgi:hypothetical protein
VDNFVQNCLDISAQHAAMRDCDRSMTKKADENLMNSIAYDEKSCFVAFFVRQWMQQLDLWSNADENPPESPVIPYV